MPRVELCVPGCRGRVRIPTFLAKHSGRAPRRNGLLPAPDINQKPACLHIARARIVTKTALEFRSRHLFGPCFLVVFIILPSSPRQEKGSRSRRQTTRRAPSAELERRLRVHNCDPVRARPVTLPGQPTASADRGIYYHHARGDPRRVRMLRRREVASPGSQDSNGCGSPPLHVVTEVDAPPVLGPVNPFEQSLVAVARQWGGG